MGEKPRNFVETIELQIGLKNYDTQKDKRFDRTVKLPYSPRPDLKICVLGDADGCNQAAAASIDSRSVDELKKLNKNKKLVKKLADSYSAFLASKAIITQISRLLGRKLTEVGKFPTTLDTNSSVTHQVDDLRSTIRFKLKKVLCMGVAIGNVTMDEQK